MLTCQLVNAILAFSPVEVDIVAVDGTVEGDGDHLGDLGGVDVARHPGAVGRAEAVR